MVDELGVETACSDALKLIDALHDGLELRIQGRDVRSGVNGDALAQAGECINVSVRLLEFGPLVIFVHFVKDERAFGSLHKRLESVDGVIHWRH